ncbi:MAG: nicotinate-nucleotide adenylyltransferase [Gomphosphaeria aponina SAG 52.96 = DSM 107014]|uniref:nicotinate-nucleotide adenylyltransferase n=1 Tax=Gomphosphaeria aponina SAG 52.96 = DSM 107014 TaxID=1521640 RepID=A0A941JTL8_9CHRO|nr:nicotinate-nucleotide adenylyltransferase [Gomphosphaeria aponina SAG 52.96 = DSM 107014]
MRKIALFGTSADPPTAAHQAILQWLSAQYDLVAVWASDNPFKNHQASLQHRMTMLNLLIAEIGEAQIKLYEELSHRRTLITVGKAREIWGKEVEFILVIGSDLVSQISSWYEVEKLLAQVQLLIVPRPGYMIEKDALIRLKSLGGKWAIADLVAPPISSTAYRNNNNKSAITPLVKDYIQREELYL